MGDKLFPLRGSGAGIASPLPVLTPLPFQIAMMCRQECTKSFRNPNKLYTELVYRIGKLYYTILIFSPFCRIGVSQIRRLNFKIVILISKDFETFETTGKKKGLNE